MDFKCNNCEKIFKSYQSRWNHMNKKHNNNVVKSKGDGKDLGKESKDESKDKIINGKKIYDCRYCEKSYKHKQTRYAHEKICKLKSNEINKNEIIELKEEIVKLKKQINKTNIQTQNNNNGTINIDNSQKIINNFGNNNMECLTDEFKKKLIKEFIFEDDHAKTIPMLIEKLNFNPDYKENNNAKISSLRSKVGYKYKDKKWIAIEKEVLLNELFKMGDELIDKIITDLDHIPINIEDGYDDFQGKKDILKQTMKNKIEMTCYLYFQNCEQNL